MRASLTQRNATTLPPPATGQRTYFDAKLPGFGLRVGARGHRSWVAVYRHQGRKRRFTLGPLETMLADEARTKAFEVLARARRGEDPAGEKQGERKAETFGGLATLYLARHAAKKKDGGARDKATLERELLPKWKCMRLDAIRRRDVRALLEAMVERGAPVSANRTLALVRKMYNFAIARELVAMNPATGLERPAIEKPRDRVLKAEELKAVWRALDAESPAMAACFRLLLLTAQRPGEVKGIRWSELDLDATVWAIPSERAKNGRAHQVPLSPPAVAILRSLQECASGSAFVLPSESSTSGHLTTLQFATRRLRKATGVDFRPHDCRRVSATLLAELGTDRLTIKAILNHSSTGDVTATYERHTRAAEKRHALEALARRINAIVTGEASSKVVSLRA